MDSLMKFDVMQKLVEGFLRGALSSPGLINPTLQGLGMLRYNLAPEVRLHIWDDRFRVPGVSEIHDHPWSFSSKVVFGHIINHKYLGRTMISPGVSPYKFGRIKCGPGGGLEEGTVDRIGLRLVRSDEYYPGASYSQLNHELHRTDAARGTVTLVTRRAEANISPDHAKVFWPADAEWVSAEPRPAGAHEELEILSYALRRIVDGRP